MSNRSDHVELTVSDHTEMHAYLARPPEPGPHPGVLVFQDGFGVKAAIRSVADRFAARGFVALAPELFHRTAPGFEADYADLDSVMPHFRALTTEGIIADATAAFQWMSDDAGVDSRRVAAMGFCLGGRATYLANTALPLAAAVSYYGGGIAPDLLDRAPRLHGPHLFFWGGKDKGIPPEQRRAVSDAVRKAGKRFVDVEFSDADHGFFTDHRHEPRAASHSWALATEFLANALRTA